ncbi:Uncharacterised protein [Vibrio cholerae]|uniref:Uncharacterized protein n=1 Tax=Vibrio cholerae TaxID=666 RepID=A0A655Z9Y3_VIBCL|nr:Uncharacterised protein [Vibrio cholerae]CSB65080.1 Uncharacterised protein [Vibrio cholerae]CSC62885.1 Uncharacterised protein [Vibrio cholerae]
MFQRSAACFLGLTAFHAVFYLEFSQFLGFLSDTCRHSLYLGRFYRRYSCTKRLTSQPFCVSHQDRSIHLHD